MKKILVLILCLGVIFISGCGDKNEVTKSINEELQKVLSNQCDFVKVLLK